MNAAHEVLRVVSYGGGVQSTALLALAAQQRVAYRTFLFANVGEDSEHPSTLRYVREVAAPFAAAHGLELVQLRRRRRDGSTTSVHHEITRAGSNRELIPVRLSNGKPGHRSCTADFKIRVIHRWLRSHGATAERPAHVAIGFSTDEIRRVRNRRGETFELPEYPLLDLGLSRDDCAEVIAASGLPVPQRSACYFCPFHRLETWVSMARDEPELFRKSAALEAHINGRRRAVGRPPVWLTRYAKPLPDVVRERQPTSVAVEDGPETCDDGHCWT